MKERSKDEVTIPPRLQCSVNSEVVPGVKTENALVCSLTTGVPRIKGVKALMTMPSTSGGGDGMGLRALRLKCEE